MLNKQRLIRISINFIIFVVLFSVSNALAIHHKIPVGGKVSSSYSFSPYWTDFVEYWRQSEIWGKPSFIHYTTKKVVKEETVLPGDTLTIYYVIEATPNAKVGTYEFEVTYEFSKSKYGPSLYEKTLSFEIKIVPGTEPSPVAKFSGSPTNGPCPLSVYFTDESTGTIDSWYWDFGDGETSTEQDPSHTYNSTGYFTVNLTVTGPGGSDTETKEDYIHVTEVATPVADIKVNNSDDPITLYQNDTLTITVSLNNNGITNNADWWLAADTPFGLFFFTFDGWTDAWVPGYQGPLFYLDSFEVLNMPVSGLPVGTYTLYFGVDTLMDGNVTWDSVYHDTVLVNVAELLPVIDSFDSPGSAPRGLAFDGTYLWNADSSNDKIYKLDTSGNVINSFDSPGFAPDGLAFDGTYLWNADRWSDPNWMREGGKIYKLDTSGNVINSFDPPGTIPRGLAFDGTYLWNADGSNDKIYKLDIHH